MNKYIENAFISTNVIIFNGIKLISNWMEFSQLFVWINILFILYTVQILCTTEGRVDSNEIKSTCKWFIILKSMHSAFHEFNTINIFQLINQPFFASLGMNRLYKNSDSQVVASKLSWKCIFKFFPLVMMNWKSLEPIFLLKRLLQSDCCNLLSKYKFSSIAKNTNYFSFYASIKVQTSIFAKQNCQRDIVLPRAKSTFLFIKTY